MERPRDWRTAFALNANECALWPSHLLCSERRLSANLSDLCDFVELPLSRASAVWPTFAQSSLLPWGLKMHAAGLPVSRLAQIPVSERADSIRCRLLIGGNRSFGETLARELCQP